MTHTNTGELSVRQELTPSTVDLFMFSAATWLTHRIHYDADYARSEGYRCPVVQGPLQGAYLSQLLSRLARRNGGQLRDMTYRHQAVALAGQPLMIEALLTGFVPDGENSLANLALRILDENGAAVTTGEAHLWLPGRPGLADLDVSGMGT